MHAGGNRRLSGGRTGLEYATHRGSRRSRRASGASVALLFFAAGCKAHPAAKCPAIEDRDRSELSAQCEQLVHLEWRCRVLDPRAEKEVAGFPQCLEVTREERADA